MDSQSLTPSKSQELPENADWASYEWNGSSPGDEWSEKVNETSDHSEDNEGCQDSVVNMHVNADQSYINESNKRDRESALSLDSLPPAKKALVSPPSSSHEVESDSSQQPELPCNPEVEECRSSDTTESPFKLMPDFSKPVFIKSKDLKIDSLSNSYCDGYSVMSESMSTNPDGSMFNSISSMWDTESESIKAGPPSLEEIDEQFPVELEQDEPGDKSSKIIKEFLQQGVVKKKKKSKKKKKLKVTDADEESAKEKKPRPNYFVGIQISCPEIHQAIVQVQEHMIQTDPELSKVLVDVATAHLTLLVATVSDESALHVACSALDHCGAQLMEDLEANPLKLTFSGIGHFSHQTVYVKIVEDENYARLIDIGMEVRKVFNEKGVIMPDERPLHPHLTIAKMSKAPRGRGKWGPRKVDSSAFAAYTEKYFGCQIVYSMQLLGMNKPKDSKRYFFNSREIIFDVPQALSDDHSLCCFPRRPFVSHHRNYTTSAVPSEESSGIWSTPALTTIVAGATITAVLAFLVVRYLRR